MSAQPDHFDFDSDELTVGRAHICAADVSSVAYWTRERTFLGSAVELTHEFHIVTNERELRFEIAVLAGDPAETHGRAALTASLVDWLQTYVEPPLRSSLLDQLEAGDRVDLGHCALTHEGFGHVGAISRHATLLPWRRLRKAHVGLDAIDILLTTDVPEEGEYGFAVRRSAENVVLLPEIMYECRARWSDSIG